jgi:nitroreductase
MDERTPHEALRPLRRIRQVREFTGAPISREQLDAIADVARWSGSSRNTQPWRFITLTDRATIERIREIGMPQTRGLATAPAAIATVLPDDPERSASLAYDDGRAAERMLIAAYTLGLAAGISTPRPEACDEIGASLGVPGGWSVCTIVALGHPSDAARAPKSPPGQARRPREEVVFAERWPSG